MSPAEDARVALTDDDGAGPDAVEALPRPSAEAPVVLIALAWRVPRSQPVVTTMIANATAATKEPTNLWYLIAKKRLRCSIEVNERDVWWAFGNLGPLALYQFEG